MTSLLRFLPGTWLLTACLALAPTAVRAESLFNVRLDTSPLVGHPAGPFAINFQLTDGGGTGDGNTSLTISDLTFGGGGPTGSPSLLGGATGSLSSQVVLTDTAFLSDFVQPFTPGDTLGFLVHLSNQGADQPTPDLFSFALLDRTGTELPTLGFFDVFLTADITASGPVIATFAGNPNLAPAAGGTPIPLGQPTLESVPESPGLTLCAIGMGLLLAQSWSRRNS